MRLSRIPLVGPAIRRILGPTRVLESRILLPGAPPEPMIVVDTPRGWESTCTQDDDALLRSFGDAFRGSSEFLQTHLRQFLPYLKAAAVAVPSGPVVDLGCGRGDLLELLREAGIRALGVDSNSHQVEGLRDRGLEIVVEDCNEFLAEAADASLAGVVSIAVAEHLQPAELVTFLRQSSRTIAPGGCLLVETSNPQCPFEQAQFSLDMTHVRPYHPLTMAFYVAQLGFVDVKIVYSFPAPFGLRVNGNQDSLYQAYAVVGTRAAPTNSSS